jgi:hypothetical protein
VSATSRSVPRSSVYVDADELRALRRLAADIGATQTRGAGAGELGSLSALLRTLARAYTADPDAVSQVMRGLTAVIATEADGG